MLISLRRQGALLTTLLLFISGVVWAAWPTTPLTTYVPGTTPYVKAADMNALQNAINRGFLGTYSFSGIKIDGTGGATAAPPAGSLVVTRTTSGTTTPTTALVAGELTKGLVPACWGTINGATGALKRGVNIASATRTGAGTYLIVCSSSPGDLANTAVCGNTLNAVGARSVNIATQDDGGGRLRINIGVLNTAGSFVDENVQFVAFAE